MTKVTLILTVSISEAVADTTDNGITLAVEQAVGQLTGYHHPRVTDITEKEEESHD